MELMAARRRLLSAPPRKAVVWNQMAKTLMSGNYVPWNSSNTSVSFSDGVGEMTWIRRGTGYNYSTSQSVGLTNGHTYYISYMYNADFSAQFGVTSTGATFDSYEDTERASGVWYRYAAIATKTGATGTNKIATPYIKSSTSVDDGSICKFKSVILVDLTLMYGDGNEPSISVFEKQCRQNAIDLTEYHPQDDGSRVWWIV